MAHRILVINHDQAILELFQLMLELEGYEVRLSLIVFEEVAEVEHVAPSLIILDITLSDYVRAMILLHQLKMSPSTMNIPIILCTTAMKLMQEQEQTLHENGIPIVYKPFKVVDMLSTIAQALAPSLDA